MFDESDAEHHIEFRLLFRIQMEQIAGSGGDSGTSGGALLEFPHAERVVVVDDVPCRMNGRFDAFKETAVSAAEFRDLRMGKRLETAQKIQ